MTMKDPPHLGEDHKKRPQNSLPLRGGDTGWGWYRLCIHRVEKLPPSPQPLPSQGGGAPKP